MGALITMGCVLSVEPKVEEVLKSIEKDTAFQNSPQNQISITDDLEECGDFEEGYSDDEPFEDFSVTKEKSTYFRSWILDICFHKIGWLFRGPEVKVFYIVFSLFK